MMKKCFVTLLTLLAATSAMAQEEEAPLERSSKSFMNIYLGGSRSQMKPKHEVTGSSYEFDYVTTGGIAAFEYALKGVRFMTEFGYQKADSDWDVDYTKGNNSFKYDETQFDTPSVISGMFYVGTTPFGTGSWFQLPIYVGFGADYVTGQPNKKANAAFAVKIRANMYFSDNVGVFIGGHYKYGIAARDYDMGGTIGNVNLDYKSNTLGLEAGLAILIGRKK